jgi:hypothetical protein
VNNIVEGHQGQALAGMVEITTAVIEETMVEGRLIEPPHNRTLTGTIIKTRGTNKTIKTNRQYSIVMVEMSHTNQ